MAAVQKPANTEVPPPAQPSPSRHWGAARAREARDYGGPAGTRRAARPSEGANEKTRSRAESAQWLAGCLALPALPGLSFSPSLFRLLFGDETNVPGLANCRLPENKGREREVDYWLWLWRHWKVSLAKEERKERRK